MESSAETVGNDVYKNVILEARDEIRHGEALSAVLKRYPEIISPLFVQLIAVGERTGRTADTLKNLVRFYQKEVARALDTFIGLLEPIMIIVLGSMVGGLVIGVLLPLYGMGAV